MRRETGPNRRRSAPIAAALAAACLAIAPGLARAQESLEAQIKATFLYRFGDFVTWPDRALPPGSGVLNICVVGRDVFGEVLDQAVAGQRSAGRAIAVYRLDAISADSGCHIAYVSGSDGQSAELALRSIQGAPVLTVTDAAYEEARGVVHFEVADDRVRFHIDEQAAADAGLSVSARLLDIALTVRRRTE